jgi:hypothetical protein
MRLSQQAQFAPGKHPNPTLQVPHTAASQSLVLNLPPSHRTVVLLKDPPVLKMNQKVPPPPGEEEGR